MGSSWTQTAIILLDHFLGFRLENGFHDNELHILLFALHIPYLLLKNEEQIVPRIQDFYLACLSLETSEPLCTDHGLTLQDCWKMLNHHGRLIIIENGILQSVNFTLHRHSPFELVEEVFAIFKPECSGEDPSKILDLAFVNTYLALMCKFQRLP